MNDKKVLVSSCLLGISCRWHGKKLRLSSYIKRFIKENPETELISVCPEMMGGLPCPRPPIKRKNGRAFFTCPDKKLRKNVTGPEVTDFLERGASLTLQKAKEEQIDLAIFCNWSPSCDIRGFTGRLLSENGVKVINTW